MNAGEFNRVTGVLIEGTCASCVKDQSTDDLPRTAAAEVLDVAAQGLTTSEPMHVFFFRGKLQSLVIQLAGSPDAALATLKAEFGPPSKIWHLKAHGICAAADQYLWRDQSTEILLDSSRTGDARYTSLSLRDRRLNAEAEARGPAPGEADDCDS